jgi:hypothetical protein
MRFMMTLADTGAWCIGIILMPCWYWRRQTPRDEARQQGNKTRLWDMDKWLASLHTDELS